jgi:hypothetical protein
MRRRAGIDLDRGYPAAGETQANSIRIPPDSRTMKWTLGPLPDRSGANSITAAGQAATRACNASSPSRSARQRHPSPPRRRQPAPVTPLLAVSVASVEAANGRRSGFACQGVRSARGAMPPCHPLSVCPYWASAPRCSHGPGLRTAPLTLPAASRMKAIRV